MQEQNNLSDFINDIIKLIYLYFIRFKNIIILVGLETKLAKQALGYLLLFILLCLIVCSAIWVGVNAGIFLILLFLGMNKLFSLLTLIMFNLSLLIACGIYMIKLKNNLTFRVTRKHLNRKMNPSPAIIK